MRRLGIFLFAAMGFCVFLGCGSESSNQINSASAKAPEYNTTITPVMSQDVSASSGGIILVTDQKSLLSGVKITIPAGALNNDTKITIGQVNNPPAPPIGLNHVGAPINFEPSGTVFKTPVTIRIPFTEKDLGFSGVTSKTDLKLYTFNKVTRNWTQARIISIETVNNIVIGQVEHFSFYSLLGLSGEPPLDLGKPQAGDILFTLTTNDHGKSSGWVPGHDGIYTGEKNGMVKAWLQKKLKDVVNTMWWKLFGEVYNILIIKFLTQCNHVKLKNFFLKKLFIWVLESQKILF